MTNWENALRQTRFEDDIKRFTNGLITWFKRANTDHIIIMSFLSNTINKKSINKFKTGWKLEEDKKPYHQAPTQLY